MNFTTRTGKTIAAALVAAGILGGTSLIAVTNATEANAATTCASAGWGGNAGNEVAMCATAWRITNMAPLSYRGVVEAGLAYCNIKKVYGATRAANEIRARYGTTKGNAINSAAEAWLC